MVNFRQAALQLRRGGSAGGADERVWEESWTYSYDNLDRLVGVEYPNGVEASLGYDDASRLTSLAYRDGAGQTLAARAYTYNAVGNRLSCTDENGQTTNYAYDAVYRLIGSEDPVQGVVEYRYDAAGNRLTRSDAWGTTSYAYNANNCLTQILHPDQTVTGLWYDANGNLVQQTGPAGTTTYQYNAADRLVQINTPNGSESYAYNALGLRVGKAEADWCHGVIVSPFHHPTIPPFHPRRRPGQRRGPHRSRPERHRSLDL